MKDFQLLTKSSYGKVSTVYKRNAVYPFRKNSMEKVSCVAS